MHACGTTYHVSAISKKESVFIVIRFLHAHLTCVPNSIPFFSCCILQFWFYLLSLWFIRCSFCYQWQVLILYNWVNKNHIQYNLWNDEKYTRVGWNLCFLFYCNKWEFKLLLGCINMNCMFDIGLIRFVQLGWARLWAPTHFIHSNMSFTARNPYQGIHLTSLGSIARVFLVCASVCLLQV